MDGFVQQLPAATASTISSGVIVAGGVASGAEVE